MTPDRSTAPTAPHELMLQVSSVVVRFGGLLALGGIDLDVAHGERLVILGPNGAGKSTLFNVIAGDLAPTAGTVTIKGRDCSALPSRHRPRMGVARTYQKARSFPDLTVEDNLYLAVVGKEGRHRSLRRPDPAVGDRITSALESVWLADKRNALVSGLSHGEKRQLEVGMAVIVDPDLMLLDEPASGLSRGERERLIELLKQLAADTTLLLIEHDMDVAFQVAERIFVMADGLEVAQGSPAEIRENQLVHDIYLGSEAA
ncbi:MAG TPA: ABC transporter ATP-binding protein [Euzebya sp.]|nr:ABC transporter ATP-binding protein [Euzebya sp.]